MAPVPPTTPRTPVLSSADPRREGPGPGAAPRGAVLVRIPAQGTNWAARLPPVPGGRVLTVSVGDRRLLAVPADDLVSSGYRIVGSVPGPGRTSSIDVLVPAALRTAEPAWWQALVSEAERVFDLRMGPVQQVLGPALAMHLAGRFPCPG